MTVLKLEPTAPLEPEIIVDCDEPPLAHAVPIMFENPPAFVAGSDAKDEEAVTATKTLNLCHFWFKGPKAVTYQLTVDPSSEDSGCETDGVRPIVHLIAACPVGAVVRNSQDCGVLKDGRTVKCEYLTGNDLNPTSVAISCYAQDTNTDDLTLDIQMDSSESQYQCTKQTGFESGFDDGHTWTRTRTYYGGTAIHTVRVEACASDLSFESTSGSCVTWECNDIWENQEARSAILILNHYK